MRKLGAFCLCFAVLIGALSFIGTTFAGSDALPSTAKLGKKIDRSLLTAKTASSASRAADKDCKALVVVFLSFDCPVSSSYAQPLADLAKTYADRAVSFVGVSAKIDESDAELARHAKEFRIPFPLVRDDKLTLANAFAADYTPEAFVLDADGVVRYRGRIDDAYAARLKKNRAVTQHNLRSAIDAVLAGKPVEQPATQAIGCRIMREAPPAPTSDKVTFYRDVLPILQNQCQSCHRPGAVGPFALLTYQQAVNWAGDIKEFTQTRRMPPWKPVEGPAFMHERRLSDAELAILAAWVDNGMPAGSSHDAPPPRNYSDAWHLGKPDLVLEMKEEFQIGPNGRDLFRCFVLPTNVGEDKYVTAVQVRPGNSRVVHHALLFVDATSQARAIEQKEKQRPSLTGQLDIGPGYSSTMGVGFRPTGGMSGWAPGQVPHHLPNDSYYLLPKGADVVLQLHYHRDGRLEKDRTSIGLYFAEKPVGKRFRGLAIPGRFLYIPAGNDRYSVKGSISVGQDCELHSVMPHMHLLGKEIKVVMTPPDGPARTLVAIKEWDYNWQETYFFKESIAVKRGTRFDVEAVYDNSGKNPNNPFSPPRLVLIGQETTNEMCFGFLGVTSDQPGRIRFVLDKPKESTSNE